MAATRHPDPSANNPLRDDQCGDDRNLRMLQALYARSREEVATTVTSVFDELETVMPENRAILEVGAGAGSIWIQNAERLPSGASLCVTDFSPGMLDIAKRRLSDAGIAAQFELADVQKLPFAAASFDVVLADHMLYHVPDISLALCCDPDRDAWRVRRRD